MRNMPVFRAGGSSSPATAQWQDAARIRENDVTAFTSRGRVRSAVCPVDR